MKNIKSFLRGINIEPAASSGINAEGDIEVFSNGLRIYLQSAVRTVATTDQTQTLTNKTMSGASNAFSNIGYSSLVLTGSIVNADISASAAIAYSKLNLTGSIVNADVNASAAIAYSKLNLSASIVNADISNSAAIAFSKLAALTSGNILVGNGSNVATSVAVSGEASLDNTGVLTLSNAAVIGKVLTGYVSGAGTVAATDTILQAIQKLNGNITALGSPITALTGDVTATGPGSVAATIANDAVTNAKLANMATQTFKGRTTAGTGDPEDLSVAQATALLNAFVGDSGSGGTKGLVPAPAAGDAAASKFLKADGTWAALSTTADVAGPASSTDTAIALFDGLTGKLLKNSVVLVGATGAITGVESLTASNANSAALSGSVTNTTASPATMNAITGSLVVDFTGAATTAYTYQAALDLQNTGNLTGSGATTPSGFRALVRRLSTNSTANMAGVTSVVSNSSTGGALTAYGVNVIMANSQTATTFYGFRNQNTTTSGALTNYYGAFLTGYAGTVSGQNRALHVDANETFLGGTLASGQENNAVTGTGASMTTPADIVVRLTDASLVSLNNIVAAAGRIIVLSNVTGNSITITNNSGGTAADRIITGTGVDLTLENNASLILYYDDTTTRWRVVGGSGSGGSSANTALSNLAAVAINTSLVSDTDNTDDLGTNTIRWRNVFAVTAKDSSSNNVIDFANRQLTSGATVKLDWSGTDVSLNSRKLTNVSAPTANSDAANKEYVDEYAISTKTTGYTAVPGTDKVILCDATSGSFTITLPAVSGNSGVWFSIKKTDSSANAITIDGNGSETIDGVITQILSSQYQSLTIVCNGTSWFII